MQRGFGRIRLPGLKFQNCDPMHLVSRPDRPGGRMSKERQIEELQAELQQMHAVVDSLTEQLRSFYAQQEQNQGWTIDDFTVAMASLNEQVCSYVEERN
jgi:hypothetical protein